MTKDKYIRLLRDYKSLSNDARFYFLHGVLACAIKDEEINSDDFNEINEVFSEETKRV